MSDEFYIGYRKTAPKHLANWIRIVVLAIGAIAVLSSIVVAAFQRPVDEGAYEFGVRRQFDGVLLGEPMPHLRLTAPVENHFEIGDALVLVSQGKYGFPESAREFVNRRVRLTGSLIYRESAGMIELAGRNAIQAMEGEAPMSPTSARLGEVSLIGELVDTKCYLGVMRPGAGKVHRACAANCLRGGIQPGLLVRTQNGFDIAIMLAQPSVGAFTVNPEWAGRQIEVAGTLVDLSGIYALETRSLRLIR